MKIVEGSISTQRTRLFGLTRWECRLWEGFHVERHSGLFGYCWNELHVYSSFDPLKVVRPSDITRGKAMRLSKLHPHGTWYGDPWSLQVLRL